MMRNIWNRAYDFWWLISIPLLIAGWIFAAAWFNPAEQAAGPIGAAVGISHDECEKGWKSQNVDTDHGKALTCIRVITDAEIRTFTEQYSAGRPADSPPLVLPMSGKPEGTEWVVILNEDGIFSHAYPLDTEGAEFIYVEDQVPGWLK